MTKQELRDQAEKIYMDSIKKIEALPDEDFNYYGTIDPVITVDVRGIESLKMSLSRHKEKLGNYKMDNYWMSMDWVCVDYSFEKAKVRFSIHSDDHQLVVDYLSGGKCKVVEKKEFNIQCSI